MFVAVGRVGCILSSQVGLGAETFADPNRKRCAVKALRDRTGVVERRACAVVGIHRSTMRLQPPPITAQDAELRGWLRRFSTPAAALGLATGGPG